MTHVGPEFFFEHKDTLDLPADQRGSAVRILLIAHARVAIHLGFLSQAFTLAELHLQQLGLSWPSLAQPLARHVTEELARIIQHVLFMRVFRGQFVDRLRGVSGLSESQRPAQNALCVV